MWLILQQKKPDDFVLATGETNTVRRFVELAFKEVDIKIQWKGKGLKEVGRDSRTGNILVRVDKKYFRPTEVDILLGDYSKAKKRFNWSPKISFTQLVKEMVDSEIEKFS
jgi:GDPmannose 4,6-dehydratase